MTFHNPWFLRLSTVLPAFNPPGSSTVYIKDIDRALFPRGQQGTWRLAIARWN